MLLVEKDPNLTLYNDELKDLSSSIKFSTKYNLVLNNSIIAIAVV